MLNICLIDLIDVGITRKNRIKLKRETNYLISTTEEFRFNDAVIFQLPILSYGALRIIIVELKNTYSFKNFRHLQKLKPC